MREGVKMEVELPAGVERAVGTLKILLPLLLGLPELGAMEKRWKEARQAGQGVPGERAGRGGWRRQAEPVLARLFQAQVCALPLAGEWESTLLTWTSLASVPSWGCCLEWRIPGCKWQMNNPTRPQIIFLPGQEVSFCLEILEMMLSQSYSSFGFLLSCVVVVVIVVVTMIVSHLGAPTSWLGTANVGSD